MMSPRVTQISPAVCSPKCSRLRSICRSAGERSPAIGPRIFGFVDRVLDLVAQRRLGILAEDQVRAFRATGAIRRRRCRVAIRPVTS